MLKSKPVPVAPKFYKYLKMTVEICYIGAGSAHVL